MKIQCLKCKEIVPIGAFEPSAEGITIRCSACLDQFFLNKSGSSASSNSSFDRSFKTGAREATAQATANSDDQEADGVVCPKCSSVVSGDLSACTACGLMRDHFASFAADAAEAADPVLEQLWEAAIADWDSDAAHEKFIARASSTSAYASAARRYRQASKDRPGDSVAAARLERIMKMAEVALLSARPAQAPDEGPSAYRGVVVMLVLILVIGAVAGIYAITKKGDSKSTRPASPRSTISTPANSKKSPAKPRQPSTDPRTRAPKSGDATR